MSGDLQANSGQDLQVKVEHRRGLSGVRGEAKNVASDTLAPLATTEVQAVATAPPIDPLDPVQLERFLAESSGLLAVRPLLPAGESGDNFYHVIPSQVH